MEITTWDIIYPIYGRQDNLKYFIPHEEDLLLAIANIMRILGVVQGF